LTRNLVFGWFLLLICGLNTSPVSASPHYSHAYQLACAACHDRASRLNATGYRFQEIGRLDHWRNTTIETGDKTIHLPKRWPISLQFQAGFHYRFAQRLTDPSTTAVAQTATTDFQAPQLLRVKASAPLSKRSGFQLDLEWQDGLIEPGNIWLRTGHDTRFRLTFGRFSYAQMMINPRTLLHPTDLPIYRLSGLSFDQGVKLAIDLGFSTLTFAVTNGQSAPSTTNSTGLSDRQWLHDTNNKKRYYGQLNFGVTEQFIGFFASQSQEATATGTYSELLDGPAAEQISGGGYLQKSFGKYSRLAAQWTLNQWASFLGNSTKQRWHGGFVLAEFLPTTHIGWSVLYQYIDAGSFNDSGSIWEGLAKHTLSNSLSWGQQANFRYRLDLTLDLLPSLGGIPSTRHAHQQSVISAGVEISL
jgi:hypothetical protein